ncbi:capsular biosynthesis protein [Micromonospora sp. NPDC005173]|uniref:polysaccharide biosynthesis C-terminal domain-containing protein n=1 Tax=Micromonospora sp. NPDC005173 TaxID=3157165 RepID=UPI0033A2A7DF
MLRLAITGAGGFLGWHVRVLLRALGWPEPAAVSRTDLTDPALVAAKIRGVDRVLHLAGVNRGEPAEVAAGNTRLAAQLAAGLRAAEVPPASVAYANSVQAGNGTPYGDAKAAAAGILADTGLLLEDVLLPNLYGEHGRPFYNSAVATFCRVLSASGRPEVHADRELSLVHVTDAAARLMGVPAGGSWDPAMPPLRIGVRELADWLTDVAATYRTGEIPSLTDRHQVRLFNTYRSHGFPAHYPLPLARRADARGQLVEAVKVHGGAGQTFCSTTRPGIIRGEHFHLAKVERFVVLRGSAEISLRRVGGDEVLRFSVSGAESVAVDMPTMWAHNLVNTGPEELITLFWTNELFDPACPDTWPEPVEAAIPKPVSVSA